MERFVTKTTGWTTGTNKTGINLYNAAATPTVRGRIYSVIVGCGAAVADATGVYVIGRSTANGTGTSFTPNNLDPGGPAGAYSSAVNHSAEPTYTSNKELWDCPIHQRNTIHWIAPLGGELVMAATQNNGAGLYSLSHTGTPTATATAYFME